MRVQHSSLTFSTERLSENFRARACSLPPEPRTRTYDSLIRIEDKALWTFLFIAIEPRVLVKLQCGVAPGIRPVPSLGALKFSFLLYSILFYLERLIW
jgi:hypothetical protein